MIRMWDIGVFSCLSTAIFALAIVSRRRLAVTHHVQRPLIERRIITRELQSSPNRSLFARFDLWLVQMLARSGLRVPSSTAMLIIVCLAFTAGAIAFVLELPPVSQVVVSIAVVILALGTLQVIMLRRTGQFNKQFPSALELMARATRAGANFESALTIASTSSDEPLKSEFSQCVCQLQMGLSSARVTDDLAARIGTSDLQLFSHTIAMHEKVGGKLATALERLSSIIRDRAELGERIRSATGIARFAIVAVIVIGLFVLVYMQFAQPEYIQKLSASPLGRKMIVYGVVSELIGLAWIVLTLKTEF